jgi:hypothetical protein
MKRLLQTGLLLSVLISSMLFVLVAPAHAFAFDQNDIIDDSVFNNVNSMTSAQIDNFLNSFPNSCISANSSFMAVDPNGYNLSTGYQYGGYVTAGKVISDAAQAYSLNPQVLITTLEKEQSLVTGRNNFSGYCNNGDQHKYAASVGYGCPDSGTTYDYNGLSLYQRNGVPVTSTGTTCVNSAAKAGFSQQVIRAAWLLKFGQQRSRGNVGWAVVSGNWNNSDDPQSCYGGPTTQGTFAVCPSQAATFHDGYYTIDGTAVHINSGATAALYWYTPHFAGNQSFYNLYTQWFGSTKAISLPGCDEATNTTRSCVWYLVGPNGQPYYTSSISDRNWLANNDDFSYQSKAFFGNAVPFSGNVPVYRLEGTDSSSFLTANQSEYNLLSANGYTAKGVDFYADPGNDNSGYPVYRLYLASGNLHKWVATMAERDSLINQGYSYEGVAFTSISPFAQEKAPATGQSLVYRFRDMPGGDHFWTADVYERDQMIQAGYHYEGSVMRASQASTVKPVYRLYSTTLHDHLYTTDNWEYSVLASQGWTKEGVSMYTNPSSTGTPVYRLYNPSSYEHFYTADAWEKTVLVNNGGFKDEGVAWYQP